MVTIDIASATEPRISYSVTTPAGIYATEASRAAIKDRLNDFFTGRGLDVQDYPQPQLGSTAAFAGSLLLRVLAGIPKLISWRGKRAQYSYAEAHSWSISLVLNVTVAPQASWESAQLAIPQLIDLLQGAERVLQEVFGTELFLAGYLSVNRAGRPPMFELFLGIGSMTNLPLWKLQKYSQGFVENYSYRVKRSFFPWSKPKGFAKGKQLTGGEIGPVSVG